MPQLNNNSAKTIMVVDDDESVLSFISFSLKGEGFNVIEAPSAEKALDYLKVRTLDLILLDIMLPQMDGYTLCQKIREDSRFDHVPVLFITAYAHLSDMAHVREVKAQGLIEKPLMYSELFIQITEALAGRFALPTRLKYIA